MKQLIQIGFIVAVIAFSLRFFDATFLPGSLVQYTGYLLLLVTLFFSAPLLITETGGFTLPIKLVFFSILLSIPMAYLAWGQGIRQTVVETLPYLTWILFFFLLLAKIPIALLEKIVVAYGIAYILLYFFQLSQAPTVLFGKSLWGDEFTVDRGVIRIIFPGAGVFLLSIFMAINKITSGAKGRIFWMVLAFFGLIIPVMQVTRQFIFGVFLMYLIHLTRHQHLLQRTLTVGGVMVFLFILLNAGIAQIEGVIEAGQRDANLGKDYIRVSAGNYFLTDFSPNLPTQIFGNGVPSWGFSRYGNFIEQLGLSRGYFLSDVGLIAVYAMFGVFAVLGFLLMWIKSFTIPLPDEYQYLKYYLWYLLLTSFTWFTVYHHHYVVATVMALYMYHTIWAKTYTVRTNNGEKQKMFIP